MTTARTAAMADLVTPMALRVAATLRVADHIRDGRDDAKAIADAEQVEAAALERVLRHLATVEVLATTPDGRYELAPLGTPLLDGDPSGLRASLDIESAIGRADLSLVHLLHSVRTGAAAFPVQFGSPFWDDLVVDPDRSASYDAQMGLDVARWAPAILAAYDWGSIQHVVDVGGGDGTLLAALLHAHPALRGTVLDQPDTVERARATLDAAGLADRATAEAGSFFEPLPPGADAYLCCAVTHDWDDERACEILRRCAEAAGPSGRVLVVEKTGGEGSPPRTEMDLRMLAYFGGRERSASELGALGAGAGLRLLEVLRAGDLSLLELTADPEMTPK